MPFSKKEVHQEGIMGVLEIVLIVVGVLLLGGVVAMLAYTYPIAKHVYEDQLVRTTPESGAGPAPSPTMQSRCKCGTTASPGWKPTATASPNCKSKTTG